jgi:D-alanyl-D-alanine dipeptidase
MLAAIARASKPAAPRAVVQRPENFVDLHHVAPTIVIDIRYAGRNNFIGHPVPGYQAGKCLLTRPAAEALARVQRILLDAGLSLKVYDCYRPREAVDYFVRWAADPADASMKAEFYPRVDKRSLITGRYIASPSAHSRGSTVDLTIAPMAAPRQPCDRSLSCLETGASDGTLDMGTGFDCFDVQAHIDANGLDAQQRANRLLLRVLMEEVGFLPYPYEWWHFTLKDEPFPRTWFDFPVK